jgi:hypothetical protein
MKTSEFVQLLQNELILPRDPHLVARFISLLDFAIAVDKHFESDAPHDPTAQNGTNVNLRANTSGEHIFHPLVAVIERDDWVNMADSPAGGINIVPQEPSEVSPADMVSGEEYRKRYVRSVPESEPPDYAGKAMDEEANAIQESEEK